MTNIFEDSDEEFLVLRNEAGQFSLWPARIDVPGGWDQVRGPSERTDCVDFIERTWSDAPTPSAAP